MSTNFPTTIDDFTNPSAADEVGVAIGGRTHSQFHTDNNDAIEALEAKVGVNGSVVTTSHDYKLSEVTGADKAVSKAGTQTVTNKTINGNNNTLTVLAPSQLSGFVPMANGGLNVALVDPNADRILFWDDSAGEYAFLTPGSGLTISGTTLSATGTVINETLTANEDLTAGQTVGISNNVSGDKVARANRFNQSVTVTPSQNNTISQDNPNVSCPIGGDKFAYLIADISNDLYVQIGDVDTDTLTTTIGTSVLVTNDLVTSSPTGYQASICKLDTDKFIVIYREQASTTIIKYVIGTVSGTTVTLGASATFTTAGSAVDTISSDYLSTDKGVMFFGCTTPTDSKVITFTTTGTTTNVVGTPASVGTTLDNNIGLPRIKKVTTDTFILAVQSGYAQVGTCIGTTNTTLGTETQFTATAISGTYALYISALSASLVVISVEIASTIPQFIAGTIAGTTPTFGTPFTGTQYFLPIYGDSATSFLSEASSITQGIRRYTISGTTISLDKVVISGMDTYQNFISMDNSYYVLLRQTTTTTNLNIQGMTNSFLGIAQATVSKGASVPILYSGKDTNQTGLVAGAIYEPNGTGGLSIVSSTSTAFNAGKNPQIKAVNATTVII